MGKISNREREFQAPRIKMVAGLGNTGAAYRNTYHNVGFAAVNLMSEADSAAEWKRAKNFSYLKRNGFIFVRPDVLMNQSGGAIGAALSRFKIKPGGLLLIHDDSDIEVGSYKIAFGRGAAGHRGVASVIERLKTSDFWRMRVGVRSRRGKSGAFVLENMKFEDEEKINSVLAELKGLLLNG